VLNYLYISKRDHCYMQAWRKKHVKPLLCNCQNISKRFKMSCSCLSILIIIFQYLSGPARVEQGHHIRPLLEMGQINKICLAHHVPCPTPTPAASSPFIRTKSVNIESGTVRKSCRAESGTSSRCLTVQQCGRWKFHRMQLS
jgi:hypothetical protein